MVSRTERQRFKRNGSARVRRIARRARNVGLSFTHKIRIDKHGYVLSKEQLSEPSPCDTVYSFERSVGGYKKVMAHGPRVAAAGGAKAFKTARIL